MSGTSLIGLIGGMSAQSSALYYRRLNDAAASRLGGYHNARSILHTLDFNDLIAAVKADRFDLAAQMVADAAAILEQAGASLIALTSVTGHFAAQAVQQRVRTPLIHIADALAAHVDKLGLRRLGFLGTRMALQSDAVIGTLAQRSGIEAMLPSHEQIGRLDDIIIEELTCGQFTNEARDAVSAMAQSLQERGAQAVVMACTELPLLMTQAPRHLTLIDAVDIHVTAILDAATRPTKDQESLR